MVTIHRKVYENEAKTNVLQAKPWKFLDELVAGFYRGFCLAFCGRKKTEIAGDTVVYYKKKQCIINCNFY